MGQYICRSLTCPDSVYKNLLLKYRVCQNAGLPLPFLQIREPTENVSICPDIQNSQTPQIKWHHFMNITPKNLLWVQLLKLVCSSHALLSFLCSVSLRSCESMQAKQGKIFTECSILRVNDFFPHCREIIVITIYSWKNLKAINIYQGPVVTRKYTHFLYNIRKLASHASEWYREYKTDGESPR